MTAADYSTHHAGVRCTECGLALELDDCCPDRPHGFTWQEPGPWAATAWPDHPCFNGQCADCDEPATVLWPTRARRGGKLRTFHVRYCAECAMRWQRIKAESQGDE